MSIGYGQILKPKPLESLNEFRVSSHVQLGIFRSLQIGRFRKLPIGQFYFPTSSPCARLHRCRSPYLVRLQRVDNLGA